jgi:riboflavin kinase / FMN adenylyltransferase
VIRLTGDPASWAAGPCAVAVGTFDGVHLGHRAVLATVRGGSARPAVLTFTNHPATVLRPEEPLPLLTSLDDRLRLIADAGIVVAAVVEFDSAFRELGPEEFVDRYLVAGLGAVLVAVGEGFRFGRGAAGSVTTLRDLGADRGFTVAEIAPVTRKGTQVRSSIIRSLLADGDVAAASAMLGRPHEVVGTVVRGDGRGRTIGIPTANVAVDEGTAMPGRGVYAVTADVAGERHPGVANLGVRPTFGGEDPTLEVHVFDFDGDVYGAPIRVGFVDRIRDERRFDSVDDLVAQIHADMATGRRLLTRGS